MMRNRFLKLLFASWIISLFILVRHKRLQAVLKTFRGYLLGRSNGTTDVLTVEILEDEDLIKWQSLLNIWDKEAERFWTRSNVFLIVNGALLVAISSFGTQPLVGVAISLFGMIFVSIWIKVNRIGKFYVDRWRILLEQIEEPWSNMFVGRLSEIAKTHKIASTHHSSTTYMLYALRVILLLWIILFIQEVYLLVTGNEVFFQQLINFGIGFFRQIPWH